MLVRDSEFVQFFFYSKKMSSVFCILYRSAIPKKTTRDSLFQEGLRRLRNFSSDVDREEVKLALSKFMNMMFYNVKEEHLEAAKKITPGIKAPTVMKLLMDDEEWCAIQVMILKKETNDIMDALSDIGANGIFVMDIKNCRI